VLAASPHNTQPWIFHIDRSRIDLIADQSRRMGTADPYGRELRVGLGCALENLVLAARARGAEPRVSLLPVATDPLLVARVDLAAGEAQHRAGDRVGDSRLYDAIGDRHTNRGPYADESLQDGLLAELTALADSAGSADGSDPVTIRWLTDAAARKDVGALMVEAQTSLLRVIETQHLIRMDGQRVVPLDVRIIATTDGDLERAVAEGRFRRELFYRLSVLAINIPPLRARGDDVLLLLDQILAAMSRRMGRQVLFAPEALSALRAYYWPGNVRELEAALERMLHVTEKSVLTLADLPPAIAQALPAAAGAVTPTERLYDRQALAERDAILRAGREAAGHLGRAAERLGISRATLWRKMKLYGLTKEHFWQPTVAVGATALR